MLNNFTLTNMIYSNQEERLAEIIGELHDANEVLLNDLEALKNAERWVQNSKDKVADIQEQLKKLGANVPVEEMPQMKGTLDALGKLKLQ